MGEGSGMWQREEHFSNACPPIEASEVGRVKKRSASHSAKAWSSIASSAECARETEWRAEHWEKARFPTEARADPKETEARERQASKVRSSIEGSAHGRETAWRAEQWEKAPFPTEAREEGKERACRPEHPAKASAPIEAREDGKEMHRRAAQPRNASSSILVTDSVRQTNSSWGWSRNAPAGMWSTPGERKTCVIGVGPSNTRSRSVAESIAIVVPSPSSLCLFLCGGEEGRKASGVCARALAEGASGREP